MSGRVGNHGDRFAHISTHIGRFSNGFPAWKKIFYNHMHEIIVVEKVFEIIDLILHNFLRDL